MLKRPPTVTVPAILLLIFEVFALFGVVSNLAMSAVPQGEGSPFAASAALLKESPEYALYSKIATPVVAVLAIAGIATALGLFKGREWSRKAGIGLAVAKLLTTTAGTTYVHPLMEKMTATMMTKGGDPAIMQSTMKIAMLVGAVGGALFWLAVAIAMIILLTRKSAVVFCRGYVPGEPMMTD